MLRRVFCKLLLVAIVIFSLVALSGDLFAQGRSDEGLERAIAAQEKHTEVLMARNGVEGTGIGLDENGRPVIRVFTAGPEVRNIPQQLEGVSVEVVVTGRFVAREDTIRHDRPVPIGVSTGHPDITAGTIGCRVYKDLHNLGVRDDDEPVYALSNNHVYANSNEASIGDEVIQPGTYDGGSLPDDLIGALYGFEAIDFSGGNNTMDAAIAATDISLLGFETPPGGYGIPSSEIFDGGDNYELLLNLAVQKYGRRTEWTAGTVTGVNGIVDVCYESRGPFRCVKLARFVDQIIIQPTQNFLQFSDGGDSGSLIVTHDEDKYPVGLLFAGGTNQDGEPITIANPIDLVLSHFGVTIDDGSTGEPVVPVADFVGSPRSGGAPLTVDFFDLSSGMPTSWLWDFGDGVGRSTEQDPSYTYNDPGTYTYTVTLTATNAAGSDVETKVGYITVTEPEPPVADFEASPTSGDAPLTVDFTDLSSGDPTSWSWDFGNGVGTSTERDPSYTYNNPGTYTVMLTATNAVGSDLETKYDYIIVSEAQAGDVVTITKAEYKSRQGELNVEATSGEGGPDVILRVYGYGGEDYTVDYGPMDYDSRKGKYTLKIKPAADPQGSVKVVSTLGGSATKIVKYK